MGLVVNCDTFTNFCIHFQCKSFENHGGGGVGKHLLRIFHLRNKKNLGAGLQKSMYNSLISEFYSIN